MSKEIKNQKEIIADGDTGIEQEEGDDYSFEIVEPFDPTLIRVDTKPTIIDSILKRIRHNEINLQPDFQRKGGIWTDKAQSRLIESILVRIPLPAFYMDATSDDEWLVVDGLQRLHTLDRFVIKNELKLKNLEFLTELNGKTYDDLSRNLQRRIEETTLIVYLIEKGTPSNVKYNIFKRINTGGLPLSQQEIRHALNPGVVNKLLLNLSKSSEFKRATNYSIRDRRMADQEFVLRYLAFTIQSYNKYKSIGDLDSFLNEALVLLNDSSKQKRSKLTKQFKRSMDTCYSIFGIYAFRKIYSRRAARNPINKALFEVWSVSINEITDSEIEILIENKEVVIENFISLCNNYDFVDSISSATGDPKRVLHRFSIISDLISEILEC